MHGLSPFPTFKLLLGCVNWKSLPKNAAVYVWYIHKPWMVILYWKNTIKTIGAKIEKELKHVFLSCASSASKFMQQCPFLWDSCAYSFHWREAPSLWNPRWTLALILKSVSRLSVWVCLCVTAAWVILLILLLVFGRWVIHTLAPCVCLHCVRSIGHPPPSSCLSIQYLWYVWSSIAVELNHKKTCLLIDI